MLQKVVNKDWRLGHDACGGLGRREVGRITESEHVFVLVVLQGALVHINETGVGGSQWLHEVRRILRRHDMEHIVVNFNAINVVFGVSEVGLTSIFVDLV